MRLDMIMVAGDRMIIVENKYSERAISGDSGLSKHYNDISKINVSIPAQILFTKDTDYEIDLKKARDLFEYGS